MPDAPPDPSPALMPDRTRWRLETALILAVGVVPAAVHAFLSYGAGETAYPSNVIDQCVSGIAQSLAILATMLFIMVRSGEALARFGVARPLWRDLGYAAVLMACSYGLYYAYCIAVYNLAPGLYPSPGDGYQFARPTDAAERAATFAWAVCNGTSEEVVLWALLFTRLESLTAKRALPVVAVAAMFAAYHLYQGWFFVGSIFLMGLLHGALFAYTRRIAPLVAVHTVWDLQLLY